MNTRDAPRGTGDDGGLAAWLRPRTRVLAGAFAAGLVVGVLATAGVALWTGDARRGETTVFALGALGHGFGVIGWAGSVLLGRGIEAGGDHLGARDWTERDSRRAMARVAWFGGGVMVGASLVAGALW